MKSPLLKTNFDLENEIKAEENCRNNTKACLGNSSTVHEVENFIEIQLSHKALRFYFISFLFISWLPIFVVVFLVQNTASVQIGNQRSEVSRLREELLSLDAELKLVRSHVMSMMTSGTDEKFQISEDNSTSSDFENNHVLPSNEDSEAFRHKREANEEIRSNAQEPGFRRKVASNSSRRGKKLMTNCEPAQRQVQCRHRFHRCLKFNHTKCSGLQAIQLKGAHPETFVETGQIGPWFIDATALKDTKFSSTFQLRADGESVEIGDPGIYFIYAQIYYLTSHSLNSFSIILVPKDSDSQVILAFCSSNAVSSGSTSEVSCYTATMHALQAGDRIYVQQREKKRRLIMRSGHSFLGFVKLGGS